MKTSKLKTAAALKAFLPSSKAFAKFLASKNHMAQAPGTVEVWMDKLQVPRTIIKTAVSDQQMWLNYYLRTTTSKKGVLLA